MFQSFRESLERRRSSRSVEAHQSRGSRIRSRPTVRPNQKLNLQALRREDSLDDSYHLNGAFDEETVQTTITVETVRTSANENRKPTADPTLKPVTEVFVGPSDDPSEDPSEVLERAQSDITKSSIYLQKIKLTRKNASAFLSLVRGDNRSWEAIAVDILRQKTRWSSITLEDCQGEYFDTLLSFLFGIDNCAYVHLSNTVLTPHSARCLQSLAFCKTLTKLQFDLIDLGFCVPLLCQGLIHNTSIKCFIASRCGLNDDKLRELFTSLPKHLEELRIFGNMCRSKGLAAITQVVQHSQHLEILDLSYQHVEDDKDQDFDVSWLVGVLPTNRVLRVLDLDHTGVTDKHLDHIVAALCANETLEEIMLNHNKITAEGIALLSSRLPDMRGLKKISMYSNRFETPDEPLIGVVAERQEPPLQQPVKEQKQTNDLRRVLESHNEEEQEVEEEITVLEESFIEEQTIYGEETVVEEVVDDESGEGDFETSLGDESSTPPPSEDFCEPEELLEDQQLDHGGGGDSKDVTPGRFMKDSKPEDGSTGDETGEEVVSDVEGED